MTRLALDALLEINAPLGVLYRHFLQDAWVRTQLSGSDHDSSVPFSWPPDNTDSSHQEDLSLHQGLFTVAISIFEAIEYSQQNDTQSVPTPNEQEQKQDNQQDNSNTIYEETQKKVISEIPTLHNLILAEYILARLYNEGGVPLAKTPFFAHFLRIYVQVPSLRFLMHRILDGGSTAAALSSMPVAAVLNSCVKIAFDVRGNILPENEDPPKNSNLLQHQQPQVQYGPGFVAGRSLVWILETLDAQGADESAVINTLMPTDPVDILDRLLDTVATMPVHAGESQSVAHEHSAGALLTAFSRAVSSDDKTLPLSGWDLDNVAFEDRAHMSLTEEEKPPRAFQTIYLRHFLPVQGVDATTMEPITDKSTQKPVPTDETVEKWAGGLYRQRFLQLVRCGILEADENGEDGKSVGSMTMEGIFTSFKGRILEQLLRILSNSKASNKDTNPFGGKVRQLLLDSICEGMDTQVSNTAADFVFRISTATEPATDGDESAKTNGSQDKNFLVERGDELRQLIYGVVLRWLEGVNSLTPVSQGSLNGRGGGGRGSNGSSRAGRGLNSANNGNNSSSSSNGGSNNNGEEAHTVEQEHQVRLICMVILGLMRNGYLEPADEYTLLYGQFVGYVGQVEEARAVYFSINDRNSDSSNDGGGSSSSSLGLLRGSSSSAGNGGDHRLVTGMRGDEKMRAGHRAGPRAERSGAGG